MGTDERPSDLAMAAAGGRIERGET